MTAHTHTAVPPRPSRDDAAQVKSAPYPTAIAGDFRRNAHKISAPAQSFNAHPTRARRVARRAQPPPGAVLPGRAGTRRARGAAAGRSRGKVIRGPREREDGRAPRADLRTARARFRPQRAPPPGRMRRARKRQAALGIPSACLHSRPHPRPHPFPHPPTHINRRPHLGQSLHLPLPTLAPALPCGSNRECLGRRRAPRPAQRHAQDPTRLSSAARGAACGALGASCRWQRHSCWSEC